MKRHAETLNAYYYIFAGYQVPSPEKNQYAKETDFGVACSDSLLYAHQTSTRMLLVIIKNWKEPKCPSSVERANKLGYSYKGILYSN